MIKKCVICGKEFESYDKRKYGHQRNHKYKRPLDAVTCSKKCSRENSYRSMVIRSKERRLRMKRKHEIKLFKIIERISFIIIILFAIFGLLIFTNITHELSHRQDLKEYVNEKEICLLTYPKGLSSLYFGEIAYYAYSIPFENQSIVKEIDKWTEKKAYSIDIIITFFFILMIGIILIKRWNLFNQDEKI